jgi:hypothetical protein
MNEMLSRPTTLSIGDLTDICYTTGHLQVSTKLFTADFAITNANAN